jgi:hypothetical protein
VHKYFIICLYTSDSGTVLWTGWIAAYQLKFFVCAKQLFSNYRKQGTWYLYCNSFAPCNINYSEVTTFNSFTYWKFMFCSTSFYYGQECYFASKQFLIFRITIAVCLHLNNYFLYTFVVNIWLEIAPYDEMNWEGRKRKYSL